MIGGRAVQKQNEGKKATGTLLLFCTRPVSVASNSASLMEEERHSAWATAARKSGEQAGMAGRRDRVGCQVAIRLATLALSMAL
jgi:hypothetical protein